MPWGSPRGKTAHVELDASRELEQVESWVTDQSDELDRIAPESVADLRDRLRRLRQLREAVEYGGVPSAATLDQVLAEVREVRRLVEAKK